METLLKKITPPSFTSYEELLIKNLLNEVSSIAFFLCDMSTAKILFVSKSVEKMTGFNKDPLIKGGIEFFASLIHPDDYSKVLKDYIYIIKKVKNDLNREEKNYSLSNEFRLKHSQGNWVSVKSNIVILNYTWNGDIMKVFGTLKNNDNIKKENLLNVKLNALSPDLSTNDLVRLNIIPEPVVKVTPREIQVLKFIAHGFSAKQIADKLFISIHTAINHRKNLIEKFKVKNTAELVMKASKIYWL